MKSKIVLFILTLFGVSVFAQKGKKVGLQMSDRIQFYSVNERYELLLDTIYHVNDGFRVYSGFDTMKTNEGKEYVIFGYPNWRKNVSTEPQNLSQEKSIVGEGFLDQLKLFSEGNIDSARLTTETLELLNAYLEFEKSKKPVHVELRGRDELKLALPKTEFEELKLKGKIEDIYSLNWRHLVNLTSGFMTIPFKLRPKNDTINFNLTTDITLGAYIGPRIRISRKKNHFVVIPGTLGLSYINVGNSETSNVNTKGNASVLPGVTWSTGLVFDLDGFNVGFVLGQDFASGVGNDWFYNKKIWYSFSVGHSFFSTGK